MSKQQTALPFRNDTVLGVCEAIGQDFGFHANWLRIAFGLAFYVSPAAVIAVYLGLGLLVAASRYAYPNHGHDQSRAVEAIECASEDEEEAQLSLAA
ncbi:MAG: PspC domain-containing protein [Sphingomicrobium sp.]